MPTARMRVAWGPLRINMKRCSPAQACAVNDALTTALWFWWGVSATKSV